MARIKTWIYCATMLLFFCLSSWAASSTVVPLKGSGLSIPLRVDTVSTGPRDFGERGLRVILSVSEIYYSIAVEEISYGLTEGDPDIITHSFFLSGFDVAPSIGLRRFTALKFQKWIAWNEFELQENELQFRVRYTPERNFELYTVKGN